MNNDIKMTKKILLIAMMLIFYENGQCHNKML